MAAARSRDKISLCARAGAPGAKGSPRFGLIFRESRYHILLPLPLPRHHSALSACPSFFALSLFGLLALDPPPSPSIVPRCGEGEREGGLACLSLDASLWMNIAHYPHCRGCFLCRHTYYVHVAEYIMQISYLRGGKVGSLESMQGGDHAGRRKEIFNFLVPSSFQS